MGYSVSYIRVLYLETALENIFLGTPRSCKDYMYHHFKIGSFLFSAEDSADGKITTHFIVIVVYQKAYVLGEPITQPMNLSYAKCLSLNPFHVPIIHYIKPQLKLTKRME
ncbi:hypothetical protein LOD99_15538 [Oopsacas minuta]|uniref:Uncharacterized protein n=1 Tax=Oopsacas minuta TaxID=111878 RepID=A0AAV7KCD3_9METZ|nr:hypothetical protein LOD99_15538 [Oopsacas minuta]